MIVVISGVSGSGKSTIGRRLAEKLGWRFYDADDFHTQANVEKMTRGEPLTDSDRAPWLQAMARAIKHWDEQRENAILACSALKRAYREILLVNVSASCLVYLNASPETIERRLNQRKGHFMKATMLASQFATLEEPDPAGAIIVDASRPVDEIIGELALKLTCSKPSGSKE